MGPQKEHGHGKTYGHSETGKAGFSESGRAPQVRAARSVPGMRLAALLA
jgi:hypothetical protein